MFNGETSSSSARNVIRSSSISGEMYTIEKSNGGAPDSASLSSNKKRRSSLGAKMVAIVGLSQWSKSTMQLSHPGKEALLFCVLWAAIAFIDRTGLGALVPSTCESLSVFLQEIGMNDFPHFHSLVNMLQVATPQQWSHYKTSI